MAERKRPRRTRERILETALALFNRVGEPNVTTADIADEMEISPGNLYYHFCNKDEIIAELFAAFERRADEVLAVPGARPVSVEDLWLTLHLLFEAMWDHRFIFRDLDEILSRNRSLGSRFALVMRRGTRTVIELCRGLVAAGEMQASEREIASLAESVALVATYWISYQRITAGGRSPDAVSLDRAAYQVLSIIAPFLRGDARALVERLGDEYL
ncbi:MAG TPA: TetR/AcrR family transcriptional regulator [Casimicrobiaceae bacterium]|nr:TetR/AcrR family transcriptional regulator [Casimicrobiaceae bacterium]